MRNLFSIFLMFFSTHLLAIGCGNLIVTVKNNTGHTCKLQKYHVQNGTIIGGNVTKEIMNNTIEPVVLLEQTNLAGSNIRLEFDCENKSIAITSRQNYCFIFPGNISGAVESSNNIKAEYSTQLGNYWDPFPGQINWRLY